MVNIFLRIHGGVSTESPVVYAKFPFILAIRVTVMLVLFAIPVHFSLQRETGMKNIRERCWYAMGICMALYIYALSGASERVLYSKTERPATCCYKRVCVGQRRGTKRKLQANRLK